MARQVTLMCGCAPNDYRRAGHRPGCWMATAETIALEAYTDPAHPDPLAGALAALAQAGHLRVPDSEGELLTLLDALTEAELLGPAQTAAQADHG